MARKNRVLWSSSCYMDRWGLHRNKWGGQQMRNTIRKLRRITKEMLRTEEKYDQANDVIVGAGYLD